MIVMVFFNNSRGNKMSQEFNINYILETFITNSIIELKQLNEDSFGFIVGKHPDEIDIKCFIKNTDLRSNNNDTNIVIFVLNKIIELIKQSSYHLETKIQLISKLMSVNIENNIYIGNIYLSWKK